MPKDIETENPLFLGYDSKHVYPAESGHYLTSKAILVFLLVVTLVILARYLKF